MYLYYYDWKLFTNSYNTGPCCGFCIRESHFNSFGWSKNTEYCKNDAIWIRGGPGRRDKDPIFDPFFSDRPPIYYIWYWDCFSLSVGGCLWRFSFVWPLHLFWNGCFSSNPCVRFCLCLAKRSFRLGVTGIVNGTNCYFIAKMGYPF